MSEDASSYVRALAEEYRMSEQAGDSVRVILVASELTRLGWNVNSVGELVRIVERAIPKDVQETPESPAPRRRPKSV